MCSTPQHLPKSRRSGAALALLAAWKVELHALGHWGVEVLHCELWNEEHGVGLWGVA